MRPIKATLLSLAANRTIRMRESDAGMVVGKKVRAPTEEDPDAVRYIAAIVQEDGSWHGVTHPELAPNEYAGKGVFQLAQYLRLTMEEVCAAI